jgi:hypothetical protein
MGEGSRRGPERPPRPRLAGLPNKKDDAMTVELKPSTSPFSALKNNN